MGKRNITRVTGIDGVVAAGRPRIKLPVNERYFGLYGFTYLDGVLVPATSVIKRVRLFVNGQTIWDAHTQFFLDRCTREGRTLIDGELPLEFADPARADKIDETVTAWNLFGETSFELEFELLDDLGGKIPKVEFWRITDNFFSKLPDGSIVKQVTKITTLGRNVNEGENDIDNLPTRDPLQRISFYGVQPKEISVDLDGTRVIDAPAAILNRVYAGHGHLAKADAFSLRFDYTEQIADYLTVKSNLNVKAKTAAAGAMLMVIESLAPGFF